MRSPVNPLSEKAATFMHAASAAATAGPFAALRHARGGMASVQKGATLAILCAALAGVSYGLSGTMSQVFAIQGLSIGSIAVVQYIGSSILLGIPVITSFHDFPSPKECLKLLGLGVLMPASAICYYKAIDLLTVGQAVATMFQYVWMVVVIQCVAERVVPSKVAIASSILVIIGTFFGSGIADEVFSGGSGALNMAGIGFGLLCAAFYALFLYFNGRMVQQTHPITRSFVISLSSTLIASLLYPSTYVELASNPVSFVPCGIVMGLLALLIPVVCVSIAAKRLDGSTVAMLASLELPAAALSGFLILGESLTPCIVIGLVLIVVAAVLSAKGAPVDA